MANYEKKIFYVTQAQYDILKNDGTVGSYTGLDSNATYFVRPIPDNYELYWDNNENQIQLLKNGVGTGDPITIQYASYAANAGSLGGSSASDFVNVAEKQTITGSKTFSSIISGSISGNAGTATKLANARTIGGVSFDGTANINLPGVNTTGNQNTTGNAATATLAATATKLATPRTIGGVSFDGSANINLPGVNIAGNQNTSGNAGTATKLATARNLGVSLGSTTAVTFDGSANQTSIPVSGVLSVANGGTGNSSIDTTPTASSSKMVTSGGVYSALATKQNLLTNPVTGTGTTHEIAYMTGTSTIGSLNTTTYPTLTELRHLKGVTSAIQTQINDKAPTVHYHDDRYYTEAEINNLLSGKINLTGGTFTGNVSANGGLYVGAGIPSKGDGSTIYYGTDIKTLNQAAGASGLYVNSAKQNLFYCLAQNDKYECFSNYRGNGLDTPSSLPSGLWYASNNTIASTGQSWELGLLFDNKFSSGATFPVANLTSKPLAITIVTTGTTHIGYTDTHYLVLNGWRYYGTQNTNPHYGKLNSYSVEICTDKVSDTWVKVFERTGVSDSIDGLYIPLWSSLGGAVGYTSFYGIRLTVTEATQGGIAGAFGITEIKLMENRPAGIPSDSVGALSLAGGTVYGDIILGSKFDQSIRPSINKAKYIGTSAYQFKGIYGEFLYENNQRVYSPNNKPTWSDIASKPSFATVATSGSYNDLSNKPSIPAAQVQSNWNATTGMGVILNKPNLATVATSGSYNDLSNKPTIPTVYNSTLTITAGNGLTTGGTFTTNQSSSSSVTVAMGTPTTLTSSTTNSVSGTTHSHAITTYDLTGTTNQITVTGAGKILGAAATLSLPQDIHTGASPTFASLNVGGSSPTWTIDDTTTSNTLSFKLGGTSKFKIGTSDITAYGNFYANYIEGSNIYSMSSIIAEGSIEAEGNISGSLLTGGLAYSTTTPTSANTNGLKIYVGSTDPATKYAGWLYIIT